MTHKESSDRRKQMVNEIKAGFSAGEIALKYDVEIATVRKACHSAGIFVANKGRVKMLEIIAALLNTKDTLHQIARTTKADYGNIAKIYRRCLSLGIKLNLRKRGRPSIFK